jgi:hypothetical protein
VLPLPKSVATKILSSIFMAISFPTKSLLLIVRKSGLAQWLSISRSEPAAVDLGVAPPLDGAAHGALDPTGYPSNGRKQVAVGFFDRDLAPGAKSHDDAALLINAALGAVQVGQAGSYVPDTISESGQNGRQP